MVVGAFRPQAIAAAVINDVGPELAPEGVKRIVGFAGQGAPIETWADAAAYAERVNGFAFPRYDQARWEAFARRAVHGKGRTARARLRPGHTKAFAPPPPPPPGEAAPRRPTCGPCSRAWPAARC